MREERAKTAGRDRGLLVVLAVRRAPVVASLAGGAIFMRWVG